MSRRFLYIVTAIAFIPVVIWYAAQFSDVPVVTVAEAREIGDASKKVLLAGSVAGLDDLEISGSTVTFTLHDAAAEPVRVVLEGQEETEIEELRSYVAVGDGFLVGGHICSDAKGERFHAKSIHSN